MVRDEAEGVYYRLLSKVRRLIETRFYQLNEYGLRLIKTVTIRGLAIKIITAMLAFNIYQLMKAI